VGGGVWGGRGRRRHSVLLDSTRLEGESLASRRSDHKYSFGCGSRIWQREKGMPYHVHARERLRGSLGCGTK